MQVTLNIEHDEELRRAVHEMLYGQVKAIVREELRDMVMSEAEAKAAKYTEEKYIKEMIDTAIERRVKAALAVGVYGHDRIIEMAKEAVCRWVNERLSKGFAKVLGTDYE